MSDQGDKVGVVSDTDRRLMERVRQLTTEVGAYEALLRAHFTAEYGLSPTRSISADGSIWELTPAEGKAIGG
jgi:hypothetical protein